jgi:hypothetical protein
MRTAPLLLALLALDAPAQESQGVSAGAASAAPVTATMDAPPASPSASADVPSATSAELAAPPSPDGVKAMSGMSILGNEEAPKSLVIVPWKSSRLGDGLAVTNALDERPGPLDREVFMRELRYYELRSGGSE